MVGSWADAHGPAHVATLSDTWHESDVGGQLFVGPKSSEVAQLTEDAASCDPANTRNRPKEAIVERKMFSTVGAKFI